MPKWAGLDIAKHGRMALVVDAWGQGNLVGGKSLRLARALCKEAALATQPDTRPQVGAHLWYFNRGDPPI